MIEYCSDWNTFVSKNYKELKPFVYKITKMCDEDLFHNWLIYIKDRNLLLRFDIKRGNFLSYLNTWLRGYTDDFLHLKVNHVAKADYNLDLEGIYQESHYNDYKVPILDNDRDNKIINYIADGYDSQYIGDVLGVSKQCIHQRIKHIRTYNAHQFKG